MSKRGKRKAPYKFRQKGAEIDKRIEKILRHAMPQLPDQFLQLARKFERFDGRRPATFKAELEHDLSVLMQHASLHDVGILQDITQLIGHPEFKGEITRLVSNVAGMAKQQAKADKRYSLLMRLVNEADARVPLSPWLLLQDIADPRVMLELQCAPKDLLAEAEREVGELRATAVLRAYADVAEPLYKLYLNRIWLLSYFKEEEVPTVKKVPSFGNLVAQAGKRLAGYPGLIDPDAGWMRNSACHNRRVYLPHVDAVEMWDENRPRRQVPVLELLKRVKDMYEISAVTFPYVAQAYMFRTMFLRSGMLDVLMGKASSISALDEPALKAAEQEITEKAEKMFAPYMAFVNSHS
jgi:hypothetical protein